jgi:hypothetical protein
MVHAADRAGPRGRLRCLADSCAHQGRDQDHGQALAGQRPEPQNVAQDHRRRHPRKPVGPAAPRHGRQRRKGVGETEPGQSELAPRAACHNLIEPATEADAKPYGFPWSPTVTPTPNDAAQPLRDHRDSMDSSISHDHGYPTFGLTDTAHNLDGTRLAQLCRDREVRDVVYVRPLVTLGSPPQAQPEKTGAELDCVVRSTKCTARRLLTTTGAQVRQAGHRRKAGQAADALLHQGSLPRPGRRLPHPSRRLRRGCRRRCA